MHTHIYVCIDMRTDSGTRVYIQYRVHEDAGGILPWYLQPLGSEAASTCWVDGASNLRVPAPLIEPDLDP